MPTTSVQIARYLLGLSWVYHGLLPKLIRVDPVEKAMTAAMGFSEQHSFLVTKAAGVGEIVFGLCLLIFYRNRALIIVNIAFLLALLVYVAVCTPILLLGAFNPVTTNLSLIGLSCVLLGADKIPGQRRLCS